MEKKNYKSFPLCSCNQEGAMVFDHLNQRFKLIPLPPEPSLHHDRLWKLNNKLYDCNSIEGGFQVYEKDVLSLYNSLAFAKPGDKAWTPNSNLGPVVDAIYFNGKLKYLFDLVGNLCVASHNIVIKPPELMVVEFVIFKLNMITSGRRFFHWVIAPCSWDIGKGSSSTAIRPNISIQTRQRNLLPRG
ncbi:hypothetical protein Goshw_011138 [Gossypium schwendimanii]|uniref:Uncharacterized protein n=1 Tax=Gossypium schwendimanii TaxID=34291 RepID=A0A7J9MH88_GOSSC|nr:hypothetical protein [Gossypium schwendimanii]